MKAEKQSIVRIELKEKEVELFTEILFKILAVEKTISPNVMRMLSDDQVKLLEEIENAIK